MDAVTRETPIWAATWAIGTPEAMRTTTRPRSSTVNGALGWDTIAASRARTRTSTLHILPGAATPRQQPHTPQQLGAHRQNALPVAVGDQGRNQAQRGRRRPLQGRGGGAHGRTPTCTSQGACPRCRALFCGPVSCPPRARVMSAPPDQRARTPDREHEVPGGRPDIDDRVLRGGLSGRDLVIGKKRSQRGGRPWSSAPRATSSWRTFPRGREGKAWCGRPHPPYPRTARRRDERPDLGPEE